MMGLDTNILVFADDAASSNYDKARKILEGALSGASHVCLTHQVLAEYFSVITSPRRVSKPLSVREAKERVLFLNRSRKIKKVYPKRSTLRRCVELCEQHNIRGARIFDALYAMTLLDNGIRRLATQNQRDFEVFRDRGLEIINPFK